MGGLFPGITGDVELDDVETWCYQTAVDAAVPAEILGPGHGFSFLLVLATLPFSLFTCVKVTSLSS